MTINAAAKPQAKRSRSAGKLRAGEFKERRIDLIRDPKSGVEVAAYSDDGPSAAHRQHAQFERALIAVANPATGRSEIRHVTRKIDTVGKLLKSGKLDDPEKSARWNEERREEIRRAAVKFRNDFDRAHLDPLAAPDLARIPGAHGRDADELLANTEAARNRVWATLARLGSSVESPMGSPLACAAWFVIGAGYPVSEFARRMSWGKGARLHHSAAEALVVGALALMAG